ncbi:MAG TPA: hypothetical protein VIJ04_04500, partial [Xanthobacteraceae bacterium]
ASIIAGAYATLLDAARRSRASRHNRLDGLGLPVIRWHIATDAIESKRRGTSRARARYPAVRRTYSGPVKGKGAMYEWDGDTHFGAGRAQIAEADAPTKLAVDLDLTRPLQGHLRLKSTLERKGAATDVAVSTNGPEDVVRYAMDTFFGGNLVPLACAADGLSKKFFDLMLNLHRP